MVVDAHGRNVNLLRDSSDGDRASAFALEQFAGGLEYALLRVRLSLLSIHIYIVYQCRQEVKWKSDLADMVIENVSLKSLKKGGGV